MNEYSTYVTSVIDGDTFNTSIQTIRLANINAPESSTPQGQKSANYLKGLVEGRQVVIKSVATDVYGRVVAHVWQYSDGLYINQILLSNQLRPSSLRRIWTMNQTPCRLVKRH